MKTTPVVLVGPVGDLYAMPSLAVSLLKTGLKRNGIDCKALYTNDLLHKALGAEAYAAIAGGPIHGLFLERLFAPWAHGAPMSGNLAQATGHGVPAHLAPFYDVVLGAPHVLSAKTAEKGAAGVHVFLQEVTAAIVRRAPAIVGFSSTYQTTNAILAMAKALREHLPKAVFVVGGNNCEGEMGRELAAKADVLDFVFQGEADFDFPRFCRDYLENGHLPDNKVITCRPPMDMDQVPSPDYSDFFDQCTYPPEQVCLTFETSRGCWWGHLRQCRFCGESALDLAYRMRSPEKAMEEISKIQTRHPQVQNFLLADSIMPNAYFNSFLPQLAESGFDGSLICETKANLSRRQVRQLKAAHANRIMPGMESLSTRLLGMLEKGTTAVVNIRLLRHCREEGIDLIWLLLVGIPGDRASDYADQSALMPLLQHLCPPSATPVRIQRNSPYFKRHETLGILDITPIPAYAAAFPETFDLNRLACFFTAAYQSEVRTQPERLVPFMSCLKRWQQRWRSRPAPTLSVQPLSDGRWQVTDTRDCARSAARIIDEGGYQLLQRFRKGAPLGAAARDERIQDFLSAGYLAEVDGQLLTLVCDNATAQGSFSA